MFPPFSRTTSGVRQLHFNVWKEGIDLCGPLLDDMDMFHEFSIKPALHRAINLLERYNSGRSETFSLNPAILPQFEMALRIGRLWGVQKRRPTLILNETVPVDLAALNLMCIQSRLSFQTVVLRALTDQDFERLTWGAARLATCPIVMAHAPSSLADAIMRLGDQIKSYNLKVIVLEKSSPACSYYFQPELQSLSRLFGVRIYLLHGLLPNPLLTSSLSGRMVG